MRVGKKKLKKIGSALSVGSLVCVKLLKNCPVKVCLLVSLQVSVFQSSLSGWHCLFTLGHNLPIGAPLPLKSSLCISNIANKWNFLRIV
jgi:hypothetical protein